MSMDEEQEGAYGKSKNPQEAERKRKEESERKGREHTQRQKRRTQAQNSQKKGAY